MFPYAIVLLSISFVFTFQACSHILMVHKFIPKAASRRYVATPRFVFFLFSFFACINHTMLFSAQLPMAWFLPFFLLFFFCSHWFAVVFHLLGISRLIFFFVPRWKGGSDMNIRPKGSLENLCNNNAILQRDICIKSHWQTQHMAFWWPVIVSLIMWVCVIRSLNVQSYTTKKLNNKKIK